MTHPPAVDVLDPLQFVAHFWPNIRLYDKQAEIMYSVRDNRHTFVPAGNGLGKDFVSGLIALWFFVSRRPARVVTTSPKYDQLDAVLWGEIRNFLDTAKYPLPIVYNHLHIRQVKQNGAYVPKSEMVGQVINKGEALLGRHLPRDMPRTLCIFDEASGIDSSVFESADTWMHRSLVIGNPWPCNNFFKAGVDGGDVPSYSGDVLYRKVIRICAEDSPSVQYSLRRVRKGLDPDPKQFIPGLVDYPTYVERRAVWDEMKQSIGLDGRFYEGREVKLYPLDWLTAAEGRAKPLVGRTAKGIGVDTAQGGDNTCWAAVDEFGLLDLVSKKTPNTAVIPGETIAFMKRHGCKPENVLLDAGGGGKEHADRLRQMGYNVGTVAFGESASSTDFKTNKSRRERTDERETRYTYVNKRAELYGTLRQSLDPSQGSTFGLPSDIVNRKRPDKGPSLREQLACIPLVLTDEGRLAMPPKNKKSREDKRVSLTDLIGCSPDEADALVLANYAMVTRGASTVSIGRMW